MGGVVESATAILTGVEDRLRIVAQNVAHSSSAGYKRQLSFTDLVQDSQSRNGSVTVAISADFTQGLLQETGNPLDLAISGEGFFQLRDGDRLIYSRNGQFRLGQDGAVVSPGGEVLQQVGGGALTLDSTDVEILADGTVLADGRPVARLALFVAGEASALRPLGGFLFGIEGEVAEAPPGSQLRQGMIEASNVTLGEEMVAMMAALRQAETGARLVQVYDDLVGRAITTFGQGAR